MREFFKLTKYILPYKKYVTINILLNLFSTIFSLFSLTMIIPFLGILFNRQALVTEKPELALNMDAIKDYVYYFLSEVIVSKGQVAALLWICIMVVLMIFLKTIFWYFASYFMAPILNGVSKDIFNKTYHKITNLSLSYFSEERKGDIMSRMSADIAEIKISIMKSIELIFRNPLKIIIFLATLLIISPRLTVFVLIFLPLSALLIGRVGKSLKKSSAKAQNQMGYLLSLIEETLSGIRIIKAFNAEEKTRDRFFSFNHKFTKTMNRVMRKRYLASPISEFLGSVLLAATMLYGGSLVLNETSSSLTSETFIYYLAVFSQIISPAKSFSTAYYNIQKGMASMDRINEIINAEVLIQDKPDAKPIKEFKDSIDYCNVDFQYETEPILKGINIHLEKGHSLAIVGQSGSGKTTLANLLPRLYDASKGEILIDGISITNYKIEDLRNLMGIVTQDSILFNDTIFNNIAFAKEGATEDDVVQAAKVANAHEFIMNTLDGYDTNIGDGGNKLSGGQKQRLSIARAVLKNPPILILDEATSSLDTHSEKLVQEALLNLMENRTSLVIAHRLSTVRKANHIIVLRDGVIIEEGNHEELLQKAGVYKGLHEMQQI